MKRSFCARLLSGAVIFLALQILVPVTLHASDVPTSSGDERPVAATLEQIARLPLAFEENHGQAPADARFVAHGPGYQVQLSSDAVVMTSVDQDKAPDRVTSVRVRFVGAEKDVAGAGADRLASTTNYFLGLNPSAQFTDIPNYARIEFDDVYPGVGLAYYGNQQQLEYDIILKPGAAPSQVTMAVDGADRLDIDKQGNLHIRVGAVKMQMKRPVVYQEFDGERRPVSAWFEKSGRNVIGIHTASYDRSRALTIDPVLVYSSYLGGSKNDHSRAIALDSAGNAYITGVTQSTDYPILSAYQSSSAKLPSLAFVTKVNSTGTALIYSTYLGDTRGSNQGYGIAVDAGGSAYITGTTTGTAFPTTSGAYQRTSPGGSNNSFVAKLGPAGNTLVYGTYILNANSSAIAIDSSNAAHITGNAISTFVTTAGAYQRSSGFSGTDPFVLKLNPTGTAAAYSTFLGGGDSDTGNSIAVDPSGNAYVGGYTASANFPVTNAFPSPPQKGGHGFITKLNPQGTALGYSVLLAGEDYDEVFGVAVDASGSVYATGETTSFNFPVTPNAFQKTKGGMGRSCFVLGGSRYYSQWPNGFVAKLAPDGSALAYSSFLGGSPVPNGNSCGGDWGGSIALDSAGHAFVAGEVQSTVGFPLAGDLKPGQPADSSGLFVAKISSFGDAVLYGTHIGWPVDYSPYAFAVAVDAKGDAYSTSNAQTTPMFLTTAGAYRTTPAGGTDAIFLKLTTGPQPIATLSTSAASIDVGQTVNATISVSYDSGGGTPVGSVLLYDGPSLLTSVALSNGAATTTLTLPVGIHQLAAVYRNNGAEGVSPNTYVAVNQPATCN